MVNRLIACARASKLQLAVGAWWLAADAKAVRAVGGIRGSRGKAGVASEAKESLLNINCYTN